MHHHSLSLQFSISQGTATLSPTTSPIHVALTDQGGCPEAFREYGLYEEGDRVSIDNNIVVECKSWPQSQFCSQKGFEPSLLSTSGRNWEHAWQVVGYCTGTKAPIPGPLEDRGCPEEWSFGNHQKYQVNDQVSVTVSTTPVKVQAVFKCKPWPYSNFCSMFNPTDNAGGHMGWTYGGDCTGTFTPTSSPTFDPLSVIPGGCPDDYNISSINSYKAGSIVSKTISSTPLQKIMYQCREWPNSGYCNQVTFAPGKQYDYIAWTRLGPCDGTKAPINAPMPTIAPTHAPTPTSSPTIAPTPTSAPTASPSQVPTNIPMGATLDVWTDIAGISIADLMAGTNNLSNTPNQSGPMSGSLLEVPPSDINGDDLGVRMRGWLVPPITGNYKFWIASDNHGELWLSSNGNPANKEKICWLYDCCVNPRDWDSYPSQASSNIPLVASQAYYFEVRNDFFLVLLS